VTKKILKNGINTGLAGGAGYHLSQLRADPASPALIGKTNDNSGVGMDGV